MEKVNNPIVTVTFTGDKWPMLLQAHSIEMFVEEPTTHYVIIEDGQGKYTSTLEWLCLLQPIYKKHKLVLMDRKSAPELFLEWDKGVVNGWSQQQYIKLKIHELINADYYLTLDSKNFFVRPTSLSEFYGYEGGDTLISMSETPPHPSLSYWETWRNVIEKHTNLSRPDVFWFAGTPFNFKKSVVEDMFEYGVEKMFIEALDTTHEFPFEHEKHVRISEYVLYGYVSKAEREELFWSCGYGPGMSEGLKTLYDDRTNGFTRPIFTLHRDRLKDAQHRKDVIDYLIFCGLDSAYVTPAVLLDRASQGHG